ncbi:MAG: epoxyqueuosine reductase QueH [Endomicrobium sp.]|nr:epoxyqueuosine reductase QueH [Endomicrobium sp.]
MATLAKGNSFDFFSTSLLPSPYRKHYIVKQIAISFIRRYVVNFCINFYNGTTDF